MYSIIRRVNLTSFPSFNFGELFSTTCIAHALITAAMVQHRPQLAASSSRREVVVVGPPVGLCGLVCSVWPTLSGGSPSSSYLQWCFGPTTHTLSNYVSVSRFCSCTLLLHTIHSHLLVVVSSETEIFR